MNDPIHDHEPPPAAAGPAEDPAGAIEPSGVVESAHDTESGDPGGELDSADAAEADGAEVMVPALSVAHEALVDAPRSGDPEVPVEEVVEPAPHDVASTDDPETPPDALGPGAAPTDAGELLGEPEDAGVATVAEADGPDDDMQLEPDPATELVTGAQLVDASDIAAAAADDAARSFTPDDADAVAEASPEVDTAASKNLGDAAGERAPGAVAPAAATLGEPTPALPAPVPVPASAVPVHRDGFSLFGRGRPGRLGRKLGQHVLDTFAAASAAARKFHAALAPFEAADTGGAVAAYRSELKALIDEQPGQLWQRTHMTLREAGIAGQLRHMDQEPAACGAVSQVYRGTWLDGTDVAVKVMNHQVWTQLPAELDQLSRSAAAIAKHLPGVDVCAILTGLLAGCSMELDFHGEAARQYAFHTAFADGPADIRVPAVLLVAPTVLVTQWADGQPADVAAGTLPAPVRARASQALVTFAVRGLVATGMTHADLHPGNVLVAGDGTIQPIDFGVCAPAPVRLPDAVSALVRAVRDDDAALAMAGLRDLGVTLKGADALSAAQAVTGLVDSDRLVLDQTALAGLWAAVARLRAPQALTPPMAAALRSLWSAAALASTFAAPVDVTSALGALPGLGTD